MAAEKRDVVVFSILKPSVCSECSAELEAGNFLRLEAERPLCLKCAHLDHLVWLPAGDTALTRRSRKYSSLSAVVVRFSRSRGRYERQGVLARRPRSNVPRTSVVPTKAGEAPHAVGPP